MPAKKIFYSFLTSFLIFSLIACSPDVAKNDVQKKILQKKRKSQMMYIQPIGLIKGKQDQNIGVT